MLSEDLSVVKDFFSYCNLGLSNTLDTPLEDVFNSYKMYRAVSGLCCVNFTCIKSLSRWLNRYCPFYQRGQVWDKESKALISKCNIVVGGMSFEQMEKQEATKRFQQQQQQQQSLLMTAAISDKSENVVQTGTNNAFIEKPSPVSNPAPIRIISRPNTVSEATPATNKPDGYIDKNRYDINEEMLSIRRALKQAAVAYGHLVSELQHRGITDVISIEKQMNMEKEQAKQAKLKARFGNSYIEGYNKHKNDNHFQSKSPNHQTKNSYFTEQHTPAPYTAPTYTEEELREDASAYASQQSRVNGWYKNY